MKTLKLSLLFCLLHAWLPLSAFTFCEVKPHKDPAIVEQLVKNEVRLIVIRHGQATHNLKHIMNSSRSPGIYLTDRGREQIQAAAEKLKNQDIDLIYVSPVFRTLQTAQILGAALNIPFQNIIIDDRLREQSWGTFEGKTFEEYESYFKSPDEDVYIAAVPGGESGAELFSRTLDFLRSASRQSHKTILVVTHAYNGSQINKILTGEFVNLGQGEYKIYDLK